MWFEKMIQAISRGIDTVEELERVEREEAEALTILASSTNPPVAPATLSHLSPTFVSSWDSIYPEIALEPLLFTDFGLVAGGLSFLVD